MELGIDPEKAANVVIGAAIEVHKLLGPGLFETAYESALLYECQIRGLRVQRQVLIPARYKELVLPDAYRIDLLVESSLVVEIKALDKIAAAHKAQVLTYLRFSGLRLGLLINFSESTLRTGIHRLINTS